jgi:outer membrane protein assembly factor BamB
MYRHFGWPKLDIPVRQTFLNFAETPDTDHRAGGWVHDQVSVIDREFEVARDFLGRYFDRHQLIKRENRKNLTLFLLFPASHREERHIVSRCQRDLSDNDNVGLRCHSVSQVGQCAVTVQSFRHTEQVVGGRQKTTLFAAFEKAQTFIGKHRARRTGDVTPNCCERQIFCMMAWSVHWIPQAKRRHEMKLLLTFVLALTATTSVFSDDWAQWRGPERDGVSKETGLTDSWPKNGPPLVWKIGKLGTGYSSPAIAGGQIYLQTTRGSEEFAIALNEKTGEQIWSSKIGTVGPNRGPQYPGSRSTATVDGELLYCLSSNGDLNCLKTADGKVVWKKQLRSDFGGRVGSWAYSESVLVDGDELVCTPGGSNANLAALDKTTGDVVWKSSGPDAGGAEYASIMVVGKGAEKQYVQFLQKGLVGVDAKSGKQLWRYDRTAGQANILTPIVMKNRIFTSGSRTGGAGLELQQNGDNVQAKEVFFNPSLTPSIGGAVLIDGFLYGTSRSGIFCADFATGAIAWQSRGVGAASICSADGKLYLREHRSGDVVLVAASNKGFRELGRLKQSDRSKTSAWPHPVIANGKLYLRDQDVLLCYEIARPNQ